MNNDFDDLLNFDPLDTAEQITGNRYNEDRETLGLGIALLQAHSNNLETELSLRGDTYYNINYLDYLTVLAGSGFTPVYTTKFTESSGGDSVFHIHYREDGLLVISDAYELTRLNTAKVYASSEYHDDTFPGKWSGGFDIGLYDQGRRVFNGEFDARIGFLHNLARAEAESTFLNPWEYTRRPMIYIDKRPMTGICADLGIDLPDSDYGVYDLYDYARQILPDYVCDAIGA